MVSSPGEPKLINQREGPRSDCGKNAATILPHIFAIGDSADTFEAINAGHTACFQVRAISGHLINSSSPN